MKICAIICEYNPFHNGHAYHIDQAKRQTGSDFIVCIMSGYFVQRGEAAIAGKYERARHAMLAGADAVVELPTVFATSNAELFAKGGVKIANALGADFLAFGAENARADFLNAGKLLSEEPPEVSEAIKQALSEGASYARARADAWKRFTGEEALFTLPNNILGVEYAKAVYQSGSKLRLVPIERRGGGYSDTSVQEDFSSAAAVRQALICGEKESIRNAVPPFVYETLGSPCGNDLEIAEKLALLTKTAKEIAKVCDCTEGLENALKKQVQAGTEDVAKALTSKRYTTSRVKRIMLQNLLGIEEAFVRKCLASSLYFNLLAVNKEKTELLSALGSKKYPLLTRARHEQKLSKIAEKCYETDLFAKDIYTLVRQTPPEKKNLF